MRECEQGFPKVESHRVSKRSGFVFDFWKKSILRRGKRIETMKTIRAEQLREFGVDLFLKLRSGTNELARRFGMWGDRR
jgi:hypothetical protein